MSRSLENHFLELPESDQETLIAGARDTEPVRGLTHGFYKYPARFSPAFVRAAISTFTKPGDFVLDPHVGGGTTLVEALALGRNSVGVDISELAEFVSVVKTTIYSKAELKTLSAWAKRLLRAIDIHKPSTRFDEFAELGYYKHLSHPSRWRIRKAIEQALWSAIGLGSPRMEAFGRCAVLRAAQWALDGRSKQASVSEFRRFIEQTAASMIEGAWALRAAVTAHSSRPITELIRRSAAGLEHDKRMSKLRVPRLVITSPPYPGVHILYHRWQVDGRKEAPLPFMIANKLDGAGSSYYTMGDRKHRGLQTYFENIKATMSSVAAVANKQTIVVQMVAFANPSWQLPRYLETMEDAGLCELRLPCLHRERDGRLWRTVPSRRWYSDQRGVTPASQEVVLFHRRADALHTRAVEDLTSMQRPLA